MIEVTQGMRKRYRILLLASLVVAFIVPFGFAFSLDSAPIATQFVYGKMMPGGVAPPRLPWAMPDAAKLFGAGALLFGLAAMVRKETN